ncbi:hypothetical protein AVEN_257250-1 [Araneus ventricosus]|uniref:Uncharacterized protein n=1 Tax=Araneus ventricosus TaxID=182803 RepID=A0A4Y2NID3_ARAVE|nr:hypothetical protein AVEN_257250-1 [Araneus ventricosus]
MERLPCMKFMVLKMWSCDHYCGSPRNFGLIGRKKASKIRACFPSIHYEAQIASYCVTIPKYFETKADYKPGTIDKQKPSKVECERSRSRHVSDHRNQRRYRSHVTTGDVDKRFISLREGDRRYFGFSRGGDRSTSSGGGFRTRQGID